MPIRRTPLPDDNQQVNIRLGADEITRAEQIAEAEAVSRSDVLRSFVVDGLDTYASEGALLPEEIMARLLTAATAAGMTEMQALQEAVATWLRCREELEEVKRPRRFPPQEVVAERAARRKLFEELLGIT
jgi:hypothetical protein